MSIRFDSFSILRIPSRIYLNFSLPIFRCSCIIFLLMDQSSNPQYQENEMMVVNALRIEVPRHPLAEKFKAAGLRHIDIADHCKCSMSYVGHIMAGYRPAPRWMEAKLQALAEEVDRIQAKADAE